MSMCSPFLLFSMNCSPCTRPARPVDSRSMQPAGRHAEKAHAVHIEYFCGANPWPYTA